MLKRIQSVQTTSTFFLISASVWATFQEYQHSYREVVIVWSSLGICCQALLFRAYHPCTSVHAMLDMFACMAWLLCNRRRWSSGFFVEKWRWSVLTALAWASFIVHIWYAFLISELLQKGMVCKLWILHLDLSSSILELEYFTISQQTFRSLSYFGETSPL